MLARMPEEKEPDDVTAPLAPAPRSSSPSPPSPRRARLLALGAAGVGAAAVLVGVLVVRPFAPPRVVSAEAGVAAAPGVDLAADAMNAGLRAADPNVAAAQFQRALGFVPTHYGATFQLARALDRAGRRDEARPYWERVLRMAEGYQDAPVVETARARLADPMALGIEALHTRHDPAAAAALFREVLAQNPEHYGATFQLATALDQAGKPAEARPFWEKMLRMAEAIKDTATADRARARLAKSP
jgi:tetratricopeptide (TPR) repeat protein